MTELGSYGADRQPPGAPAKRRLRRRGAGRGAILAVTVLVAVLDVVVLVGRSGQHDDPGAVAVAYFQAVARDDAAAARARLTAPASVDAVLWTQDELGQVQTPMRPRLLATHRHGDTADVTLTMVTAGLDTKVTVHLTGRRHGLFGGVRWQVTGGLPVLRLRTDPPAATAVIAGHTVALHAGRAQVVVFPGSFGIDVPAAGALAEGGQTVLALDQPVDVTVQRQPTSQAQTQALKLLVDQLSLCNTVPGETHLCPLPAPGGDGPPQQAQFQVTSAQLTVDSGGALHYVARVAYDAVPAPGTDPAAAVHREFELTCALATAGQEVVALRITRITPLTG